MFWDVIDWLSDLFKVIGDLFRRQPCQFKDVNGYTCGSRERCQHRALRCECCNAKATMYKPIRYNEFSGELGQFAVCSDLCYFKLLLDRGVFVTGITGEFIADRTESIFKRAEGTLNKTQMQELVDYYASSAKDKVNIMRRLHPTHEEGILVQSSCYTKIHARLQDDVNSMT